MKFIFLGPPGAGKGTLAAKVATSYNIPHISTGEIFRAAIKAKTPLGLKVQAIIDSGALVSDDITVELVKDRLSQSDAKDGFILDGFPRTPDQLEIFVKEKIADIDVVVNLEVPYETLLSRVVGRRTCKGCGYIYNTSWGMGYEQCPKCGGEWGIRSDDNEETYKTRYDVYLRETLPILDYFKKEGKVIVVEGQSEPEESYQNMIDAFKTSNIKGLKEFIEG